MGLRFRWPFRISCGHFSLRDRQKPISPPALTFSLQRPLHGLGVLLLLTAALATPPPTAAYGGLDNYQLTKDEVALLPAFCRHTQLIIERHGSPAEQRAWTDRVGPSFLHMHHYCIAVVAYVRSFRHNNTINDRQGYLVFAWQNLTYVVRNAEASFSFLPEVFYRRGQVSSRQGRVEDAIKDLEEALRGDPKHVRAAHELAQVLLAKGDRPRAAAVVKDALELTPGSRLLQSTLSELGKPKK